MKRDEKLGEWYSRTLIDRNFIVGATKEEISKRVALAEAANTESGWRPMPSAAESKRNRPSGPRIILPVDL